MHTLLLCLGGQFPSRHISKYCSALGCRSNSSHSCIKHTGHAQHTCSVAWSSCLICKTPTCIKMTFVTSALLANLRAGIYRCVVWQVVDMRTICVFGLWQCRNDATLFMPATVKAFARISFHRHNLQQVVM